MMLGLGDTTTTAPSSTSVVTVAPSSLDLYMAGLKSWSSPSAALSALGTTLSNASSAFSGTNLPAALGLWTVPLLVAAVALSASAGKGRR